MSAASSTTSRPADEERRLAELAERWPERNFWRSRDGSGRPAGWYATARRAEPGQIPTLGADTADELERQLTEPEPRPELSHVVTRW